MRIILALSTLVAVTLADTGTIFEANYYPVSPRSTNTDPNLKVVNGHDAERGQFPYIASVRRRAVFSFVHVCGGSILAPNWILTAAHCVSGDAASMFQVIAGILQLHDQNVVGQQTVNVAQIINHPRYPGGSVVSPDDISLLRLASNLQYGINVQPISIPRLEHQARGDAVLSGWGLTNTGSIPDYLQWVSVPVVEERECRRILDNFLTPARNPFSEELNVCSGIRHGGESACQGDSGGPLAQGDLVIGVVSWTLTPCGQLNGPSVYAKVSAYADWIVTSTNGQVRPR